VRFVGNPPPTPPGGVVADSVPASEYEETMNKAKAMLKAVEIAERGF
jgi:anthranilate/para-aminobenzoate synthase component I